MKKDSKQAPTANEQTAEARQEYKSALPGSAPLIQTAKDLRNRARQIRDLAREVRTRAESRRVPILIMSWEPETLRPLSVEIEASGFVVMYTREPSMFLQLLETRDFACAVIGDSIPPYIRMELLRDSKESKPDMPLVVLEGREEEIAALKPYAAKVVESSEPVSHVLRAIRSVTRKPKPQVGAESAIAVNKAERQG
jgi:DNA-binding NtrC family response regulator